MKNLLLLLLFIMTFSCNNSGSVDGENTGEPVVEEEVKDPELPGEMGQREWKLIKYTEAGEDFNLQGAEEVTLKFTKGRCFGIGGCNNYSAEYTLTGENAIQFGEIAATKKICNSIMGQEIKYFELLKAVTSYEYKDGIMTMSGPNGSLVYRYKPPTTEPKGN